MSVFGDLDRRRATLLLGVCLLALAVFVAFVAPVPWRTTPGQAACYALVVLAFGVWEFVLDDAFSG